MKRSNSLPNYLDIEYQQNIKKNKSFNNFCELDLKGCVKYLSYGQFLTVRKETTREERQKAIKNHYFNYKN